MKTIKKNTEEALWVLKNQNGGVFIGRDDKSPVIADKEDIQIDTTARNQWKIIQIEYLTHYRILFSGGSYYEINFKE